MTFRCSDAPGQAPSTFEGFKNESMITLLETAFSVVDHLWTQDSSMFPLTSVVKRDLISIKEGQNLGFEILSFLFQNGNDY